MFLKDSGLFLKPSIEVGANTASLCGLISRKAVLEPARWRCCQANKRCKSYAKNW
jgi:hypothetical protein